jgi:hypothetical protein
MSNLFDFVNSINYKKENILTEENQSQYVPYVVNKSLSYFIDTIFQANEMNVRHTSDKRLQFDFLLNSVRSKKRFSKWAKPEKLESIEVIKEYYGYNDERAKEVVNILCDADINKIKDKLDKGGAK